MIFLMFVMTFVMFVPVLMMIDVNVEMELELRRCHR